MLHEVSCRYFIGLESVDAMIAGQGVMMEACSVHRVSCRDLTDLSLGGGAMIAGQGGVDGGLVLLCST